MTPRTFETVGLRGQPDERIFLAAQERSAILLTADLDFTNIVRFPPHAHQGLIILRLPNDFSIDQLCKEVSRDLQDVSLDSLTRTIVIIEPQRTRIRRFD